MRKVSEEGLTKSRQKGAVSRRFHQNHQPQPNVALRHRCANFISLNYYPVSILFGPESSNLKLHEALETSGLFALRTSVGYDLFGLLGFSLFFDLVSYSSISDQHICSFLLQKYTLLILLWRFSRKFLRAICRAST